MGKQRQGDQQGATAVVQAQDEEEQKGLYRSREKAEAGLTEFFFLAIQEFNNHLPLVVCLGNNYRKYPDTEEIQPLSPQRPGLESQKPLVLGF